MPDDNDKKPTAKAETSAEAVARLLKAEQAAANAAADLQNASADDKTITPAAVRKLRIAWKEITTQREAAQRAVLAGK